MTDVWICAWRELRRRKARTVVSIIGYAAAVAVVIVIGSQLRHSREAADFILSGTGTHFIAFVPGTTNPCPGCSMKCPKSSAEGFIANGVNSAVFSENIVEQVRRIPSVKAAAAYLCFRFESQEDGHTFVVGGFDIKNADAVGSTCCAATDIIKGRFLNNDDHSSVMLEEAYAKAHNFDVGDKVRIADRDFDVVGVVNPGVRPAKVDIYMPYNEAQDVINVQLPSQSIFGEANVILVEVKSSTLQDEAMHSVRALLRGMVISTYGCYRPAASVIGINERAAWILMWILGTAIVLLAAKTEWSSVIERRREIGILKALGWSNGNIINQILAGSVLQAFGGAVTGVLASMILLLLLPHQKAAGVHNIYWGMTGIVLVIAVISGLVAGIIPAIGAVYRRPAEALRSI